jgi:hypothetical protein
MDRAARGSQAKHQAAVSAGIFGIVLQNLTSHEGGLDLRHREVFGETFIIGV